MTAYYETFPLSVQQFTRSNQLTECLREALALVYQTIPQVTDLTVHIIERPDSLHQHIEMLATSGSSVSDAVAGQRLWWQRWSHHPCYPQQHRISIRVQIAERQPALALAGDRDTTRAPVGLFAA